MGGGAVPPADVGVGGRGAGAEVAGGVEAEGGGAEVVGGAGGGGGEPLGQPQQSWIGREGGTGDCTGGGGSGGLRVVSTVHGGCPRQHVSGGLPLVRGLADSLTDGLARGFPHGFAYGEEGVDGSPSCPARASVRPADGHPGGADRVVLLIHVGIQTRRCPGHPVAATGLPRKSPQVPSNRPVALRSSPRPSLRPVGRSRPAAPPPPRHPPRHPPVPARVTHR